EVLEDGAKEWKSALVGFCGGKRIPFKALQTVLNKKGENAGRFSIHTADNGIYIFKYESSIVRDWILENGPWYVWGISLALRLWEKEMPLMQCSFTKVPILVKLMNILMEYWTHAGLSRLDSLLGNPLHMDAATESKQKINFARLCMEMSATSKFPANIRARWNNGVYVDVKVEYCWMPVVCEHCKVFNHNSHVCPVATKLVKSPAYGTVSTVKVNALKVWVRVGNRGKDIRTCDDEHVDMHLSVPGTASPSKALDMVDKQKVRVDEPTHMACIDRNPIVNIP
ncbi:DUF4283 domain-containing protein, partial [Cephalotus follicularis]